MCKTNSRLYNFLLRMQIDLVTVTIQIFLTNSLNRIIKKNSLMDLLTI
nr:MAG TPA: hypothetical protein [Caudoviricetes sp.]